MCEINVWTKCYYYNGKIILNEKLLILNNGKTFTRKNLTQKNVL